MKPRGLSASSSSSRQTYHQLKSKLSATTPTSSPAKTIAGRSNVINNVLFVQEGHVNFEPPNQKVSVFFDECNREIIRLTSGVVVGNSTASSSSSSSSPTTTTTTSNQVSSSSSTGSDLLKKTRVVFQATDRLDKAEFLLPLEKRILSIKFNPTRTVLAYHVEKSNVEFINVRHVKTNANSTSTTNTSSDSPNLQQRNYVLDDKRYIQTSRAKNSKLFGFLWTGPMEMVMITDISIEYYHVDYQRRRLKFIKSFQSSTNWFVYQPCHALSAYQVSDLDPSDTSDNNAKLNGQDSPTHQMVHHSHSTSLYSILMVSTGSLGNSLQPYMFSKGQIHKMQKFDVDGNWKGSEKVELFERSITIASIYGQVRLLVLQHESLNLKSRGAQILLYTVDQETGITYLSHTLDLDADGRFAINIVDNLIVAHDQPTKTSFIFDIMIESTEKSDCPRHFVSLMNKQTIRPLKSKLTQRDIELYSPNWVFFQPNFIIDAKAGLLLTLHLNLNAIRESIQESLLLLNFLSYRKHSEQIILDECRAIVSRSQEQVIASYNQDEIAVGSPLMDVSSAFGILAKLVISTPELPTIKRAAHHYPDSGVCGQQQQEQRLQTSGSSGAGSTVRGVQAGQQKQQQQQQQQMPAAATSTLRPTPPQQRSMGAHETSGSAKLRQQHNHSQQESSSAAHIARLPQADVSREVLSQLNKFNVQHPAQYHFVWSTLMEFIFACRRLDKNVDFCIYEQLVNCILNARQFYQLIQMIRSNILKDSKQLACLLLTNRSVYTKATQLGLDMLQRLNCLTDLIESINLAPYANFSACGDAASRLSIALHQSIEAND